jgi:putative membrane protein
MFFEIIIAIFLGCLAGVITGLIPGLHINLVALILLGISPVLLGFTNVIAVASFIISMSITHTFTDFISATYLGAPSDATAMAVMPAHRLLLKGKGHEAIRLATIGSLLCLILTIALAPLLVVAVPFIFSGVKNYVGWILLAVIISMILREHGLDKKFWIFMVIMLSGILGLIALNMPNLKDPLLPMLSGLFGVSVLLHSLSQKVVLPPQKMTETVKVKTSDTVKSLTGGVLSGSIVSIFPGLGPAQAAVISGQFFKRIDSYSYLILVGGINTVSMILSLITLFTIEKARNGSIIVVQQLMPDINLNILILFFSVALAAGGIAAFSTMYVSRIFSRIMNKINYSMLSIIIIAFVAGMVLYFSGLIGFLIFIAAAAIGIVPILSNVSRSSSMACLLVPIILANLL